MPRPLSFERACAQFVHRYTMEHVPTWSRKPVEMTINGAGPQYYAPQYRSDREWYDKTLFYGESAVATRKSCYSSRQSWPLGYWLDKPFQRVRESA